MRKSKRPTPDPPYVLLRDVLPDLSKRLTRDLRADGQKSLANQIDDLRIYGYCTCGTSCGTFYCVPDEEGEALAGQGVDHGSVTAAKGKITRVETLDPSVHEILARLLPPR